MVHNLFAVIDLVQLWRTMEKMITLATKYKIKAYHTKTQRKTKALSFKAFSHKPHIYALHFSCP